MVFSHARYCDLLEAEVARFAAAIDARSGEVVPSCPGWTVADLTLHLGTIHRWADHMVRVRAAARIPRDEMDLDAGPPTPTPRWLRAGGDALAATLRGADPDDDMWAWGPDKHVRFWSRRQLHETLVHRVDAEQAARLPSGIDADVAADAIDELLTNLGSATYFSPGVAQLRGSGRLSVRATDTGDRWAITLTEDGFSVATLAGGEDPDGDGDLAGPAAPLLLVLYRRLPPSTVTVTGDVARFWLEHSALE